MPSDGSVNPAPVGRLQPIARDDACELLLHELPSATTALRRAFP